jgi:glucan phosphoethanolaminetransferase (alkaline phosphatase superfamily)
MVLLICRCFRIISLILPPFIFNLFTMLQRIQSVFMFLAIISGVLIFFFPIATYYAETSYLKYFIYMINDLAKEPFPDMKSPHTAYSAIFTLPVSILQVAIIGLLFLTIFKYRSRTLQMKLNRLNVFLNVILIGGIFFASYQLETITGTTAEYGAGAVFPLVAIVLVFIANYHIKKDEKLVRSADRLR